MQRIRSTDELTYGICSGFSKNPDIPRVYGLTSVNVLGRKKVTVDNPRPLRDYRYDMIPKVQTRTYKRTSYAASTYRGKYRKFPGKKIKTKIFRTYTKYVSLKRPKGPKSTDPLMRLNDFQVAQFLGYCTSGTLKTPNTLPPWWTQFELTGTLASEGSEDPYIQSVVGFTLTDLTRPLELDETYANTALARSMAKVSAPDVDFAEIVGELGQLVRLAEDPIVTLVGKNPRVTLGGLLRKFQRYFSADAWICKPRFLPKRGNLTPKNLAYNALDLPNLLSGRLSVFTFRTRRKVGRRKIADAVLLEAANRWLQYRYGIAPLMSDITEIISKFSEKIKQLVKIRVAKTTVVSNRSTKTWTWTKASYIPGFTYVFRIKYSVFDRTTAKVFFRLKLCDKYIDLRDLGLDSSNIIPVIHELGPWSFVVDWFYGIESWLRSWNQDPSLEIVGNCVSRKRDVNILIEIVEATYYGYPCQVPASRCYLHRQELCRKVNRPIPEYPVFNPDFLKWRRVLDSLSLLWAKMPALRR